MELYLSTYVYVRVLLIYIYLYIRLLTTYCVTTACLSHSVTQWEFKKTKQKKPATAPNSFRSSRRPFVSGRKFRSANNNNNKRLLSVSQSVIHSVVHQFVRFYRKSFLFPILKVTISQDFFNKIGHGQKRVDQGFSDVEITFCFNRS